MHALLCLCVHVFLFAYVRAFSVCVYFAVADEWCGRKLVFVCVRSNVCISLRVHVYVYNTTPPGEGGGAGHTFVKHVVRQPAMTSWVNSAARCET